MEKGPGNRPFFINMKTLEALKTFSGAPNGFDTRKIEKGEVFDASDSFAKAAIKGKQCKNYKPAPVQEVEPEGDDSDENEGSETGQVFD